MTQPLESLADLVDAAAS